MAKGCKIPESDDHPLVGTRLAPTIPAVSTISVAKWTFRKRIVLWCVLSMVGSYLKERRCIKTKKGKQDTHRGEANANNGKSKTHASENDPVTKECVKDDFPTALKPRIATLRCTRVGSFPPMLAITKILD